MASLPQPGIIQLDLHGQNAYQAQVTIDAALRRAGASVCRLRLIHGHHLGTSLRDMIDRTYPDHPKVLRLVHQSDGVTDLVLRELVRRK